MTPPTVGILVDRPPPDELAAVLAAMTQWCRPIAVSAGMPAPVAWVCTSPELDVPDGAPFATWIAGPDELAGPTTARAVVLLTNDPATRRDATQPVVLVRSNIDFRDIPAITPFVRQRYRRLRGLPEQLVLRIDPDGRARTEPSGVELDADGAATALALAGAAIVIGPGLARALAWGTPCVTDAPSAAAIGAVDRVHVRVAEPNEAVDTALALAVAPEAAMLSQAGRRLVETSLDVSAAARRVVHALGVGTYGPGGRLDAVLDELTTPRSSSVRRRMHALVVG